MAGNLTVLDGNTFFVSDAAGDVEPGNDANGFFHADMRQLSTWRLLVNGQPVHVLTSRTVDYYSASVFATLASVSVGEKPDTDASADYARIADKVLSTRFCGTIKVTMWRDGEVWVHNHNGERVASLPSRV